MIAYGFRRSDHDCSNGREDSGIVSMVIASALKAVLSHFPEMISVKKGPGFARGPFILYRPYRSITLPVYLRRLEKGTSQRALYYIRQPTMLSHPVDPSSVIWN
jgi:hypothetical protein